MTDQAYLRNDASVTAWRVVSVGPICRPCRPFSPGDVYQHCIRNVVGRVQGMNNSEVEGWTKYVTAGIALFEVVEDDLLPIKPIGIQVVGVAVLMCWSSIGSPPALFPVDVVVCPLWCCSSLRRARRRCWFPFSLPRASSGVPVTACFLPYTISVLPLVRCYI